MERMSEVIPGQYTVWRALLIVLSIPWWEAWRRLRTSRLRVFGTTILCPSSTRPSSSVRVFSQALYPGGSFDPLVMARTSSW